MIPLRLSVLTVCVTFLALAADPPANPKLDTLVREAEKQVAKVRGLEFKMPVKARILPRPDKADKGVNGYYTPRDKMLVVYEDVAENYAGGVLIHELVHALQDQHFGLAGMHDAKLSGDEELARAALIEGDASFTMIEVLKGDQPKISAMLDSPLSKAKNPRNAFLYGQGARYVQALHQKGGWKAVDARYKFPPTTTAEILHPGERIGTVSLGGKGRGEFGLAEWLKGQGAEWPDALAAVNGWRGDRVSEKPGGTVTEVVMAKPEQAEALQAVFAKLAKAKDTQRASARQGGRVLYFEAKDAAGLAKLKAEAAGPPRLLITTRAGQSIGFGAMLDRLAEADFVCVGESHDSDPHHRVQLQIIQALYALDPRLGVGMEMFQKPYQAALDGYVAGSLGEEELLTATEYRTRWGFEWVLYQPIVRFCKANGLPVAALNAPRELTRRIREVGIDGLKADEKPLVAGIDFNVPAHREHWYERLAAMHGQATASKESKDKGYAIMTVWDGFMARSAAEFLKARGLRRLVVLAGSGHIDRGFGIPDRAAKLSGGKAATVQVVLDDDKAEEGVADFTIRVR